MYTSYFAKSKKLTGMRLVSISNVTPKWFEGEEYKALAPNWDTIDAWKKSAKTEEDWNNYKRDYYKSKLSKLDAKKVYEDLKDAVLLCYEKEAPCHRFEVANWLEKELGIKVEEL